MLKSNQVKQWEQTLLKSISWPYKWQHLIDIEEIQSKLARIT